MPRTLFYSWQSDLPNNLNRARIRRAIDDAVAELNKDLDVEDAIRVDQDTQGAPGSPPITDTILRKIEECGVFIPDVTFIAGGKEDRPTPNPNVMIEYGYALKVCGDKRIIPVFNTAFGRWEDLPFDMRHKRRPILYEAADGMSDEQRREARQDLSKKLLAALQTVAAANLLDTVSIVEEGFRPAEAQDSLGASFLRPGEGLGMNRDEFEPGDDQSLQLRGGSKIYMRLWPTEARQEYNNVEVRDLVQKAKLRPMCSKRSGGWSYARNRYGAFSFYAFRSDLSLVIGVTELFKTGEIWGIDTYYLSLVDEDSPTRYVPTTVVMEELVDTLANYLAMARDHLDLAPPLRLKVGMVGVAGYRLAVPGQSFAGDILENTIDCETQIDSYDLDAQQYLKPFFDRMFDAAGELRPQ